MVNCADHRTEVEFVAGLHPTVARDVSVASCGNCVVRIEATKNHPFFRVAGVAPDAWCSKCVDDLRRVQGAYRKALSGRAGGASYESPTRRTDDPRSMQYTFGMFPEMARAYGFAQPPRGLVLKMLASLVETAIYKESSAQDADTRATRMVMIAGAIAAMNRLVLHKLQPAVVRLADETDLHSLPPGPPRLLTRPFAIESRQPSTGERLFGNTSFICGYPDVDGIRVFGMELPQGSGFFLWRPKWGAGELDLEEGIGPARPDLLGEISDSRPWAMQIARFLLVFGLLLDAEGVPIRIQDEPWLKTEVKKKGSTPSPKAQGAWKRVYIDLTRSDSSSTSSDGTRTSSTQSGDLKKAVVQVRGHLRRQACGPQHRDRKWIWIEGFASRRWVSPAPQSVLVR